MWMNNKLYHTRHGVITLNIYFMKSRKWQDVSHPNIQSRSITIYALPRSTRHYKASSSGP